jgi:hypothetical protein
MVPWSDQGLPLGVSPHACAVLAFPLFALLAGRLWPVVERGQNGRDMGCRGQLWHPTGFLCLPASAHSQPVKIGMGTLDGMALGMPCQQAWPRPGP